ncbi:hypothetical protein LY71_104295 [Geodermatophilus tzadiensis]|uniref:Uncharacterized protein n=1 Tax=Geodermatophilus tzadiensis TaxID=1137988 RepID=A0A2T0TXK3_9ACTN|nr:hypothetical protein [Geodermatophilus tzadiensis]PRY50258.1 hypothetical protein LY71_104295 [Geodermatophilus tzadiensis]
MDGQQPIEPSEVYRADGSLVPQRRTALGTVPAAVRSLLPVLLRGTTAGPLITASAFAVAAAVTARAAEAARQVAEQAVREALVTRPTGSWIEVSVTRIEVRWPR